MSSTHVYDYVVKCNDTSPPISATLLQDGLPYDLTGATVNFHMRLNGAALAKVDSVVTIIDSTGGIVEYDWQAGDLDTPGIYQLEWEVTNPDTSITTFPSSGYTTLKVEEDLA